MDVDVIVPVLNGADQLRRLLEAVRVQRTITPNLIVVDNGSTDGSLDIARETEWATALQEPVRSSYAARNRGLQVSVAPIVAFIDADCLPQEDWLAEGCAALEATGLDLIAGRVMGGPTTTVVGRYDATVYLDQERFVDDQQFGATANLFVRRRVFDAIGGFNGMLRSGGDLEFCWRARDAGFRIGYAATACVVHAPRESIRQVVRRAWRQGLGHAQVGLLHPQLRKWSLSPRRLVPPPHAYRRLREAPAFVLLDLLVEWVSYSAQLVALGQVRWRRWGDRRS